MKLKGEGGGSEHLHSTRGWNWQWEHVELSSWIPTKHKPSAISLNDNLEIFYVCHLDRGSDHLDRCDFSVSLTSEHKVTKKNKLLRQIKASTLHKNYRKRLKTCRYVVVGNLVR